MRRVGPAWFAALLIAGCAPLDPPPSLEQLRLLAGSERADEAERAAPLAWDEGLGLLTLSETALDARDREEAVRLARLGQIQLAIALAEADRAVHDARLAEIAEVRAQLELERERLGGAVERLEEENERRRMRSHLERVVSAERLRAAADEEIRARGLTEDDRAVVSEARRLVGGELVHRAALAVEVLGLLETAGPGVVEAARRARGALELARKSLASGALDELMRHAEIVGVEARHGLSLALGDDPEGHRSALSAITAALRDGGFEVRDEELGPSVSVPVATDRRGRPRPGWEEQLDTLSSAVRDRERVHLFVVATVTDSAGRPATRGCAALTGSAVEHLASAGIAAARLHAVPECGATSPLLSLTGRRPRVAVLLIPLP